MAYKVSREKPFFVEDLELVDSITGKVVKTISVRLNPDSVVEKISRSYIELVKTQQQLPQLSTGIEQGKLADAYEKLGLAGIRLFESVFGEADTRAIVTFYESNYTEMIKQVTPFIIDVALPQIKKMSHQNKQDILALYNRKTRRSIRKRR